MIKAMLDNWIGWREMAKFSRKCLELTEESKVKKYQFCLIHKYKYRHTICINLSEFHKDIKNNRSLNKERVFIYSIKIALCNTINKLLI